MKSKILWCLVILFGMISSLDASLMRNGLDRRLSSENTVGRKEQFLKNMSGSNDFAMFSPYFSDIDKISYDIANIFCKYNDVTEPGLTLVNLSFYNLDISKSPNIDWTKSCSRLYHYSNYYDDEYPQGWYDDTLETLIESNNLLIYPLESASTISVSDASGSSLNLDKLSIISCGDLKYSDQVILYATNSFSTQYLRIPCSTSNNKDLDLCNISLKYNGNLLKSDYVYRASLEGRFDNGSGSKTIAYWKSKPSVGWYDIQNRKIKKGQYVLKKCDFSKVFWISDIHASLVSDLNLYTVEINY